MKHAYEPCIQELHTSLYRGTMSCLLNLQSGLSNHAIPEKVYYNSQLISMQIVLETSKVECVQKKEAHPEIFSVEIVIC